MWRIVVGLMLVVGCGEAVARPFMPPEETAVPVGPVGSTPAEPMEGVIRCALQYDGITVCWMVTDSVTVREP